MISKYMYFAPMSFKARVIAACQDLCQGHLPTLLMFSSSISIMTILGEEVAVGLNRNRKSKLINSRRLNNPDWEKATIIEATTNARSILMEKVLETFKAYSKDSTVTENVVPLTPTTEVGVFTSNFESGLCNFRAFIKIFPMPRSSRVS